jgi:hypothetical protein
MASPNPGISAAGEAAGRTALNPSAGPAAIGGMLVPGEEPEVEPTESMKLQKRLSSAVSDITKLANAMEALSVKRSGGEGGSGENDDQRGEDERSMPTPATWDSSNGDAGVHVPRTVGSMGESTPKFSDFTKVSRPTPDTQHQAASHYRT